MHSMFYDSEDEPMCKTTCNVKLFQHCDHGISLLTYLTYFLDATLIHVTAGIEQRFTESFIVILST